MADIDTIAVTQDNVTTTYLIRDVEGRELITNTAIAETADAEISLLRAGLGAPTPSNPYSSAYDAVNAVIPRWKVCS